MKLHSFEDISPLRITQWHVPKSFYKKWKEHNPDEDRNSRLTTEP